MVVPASAVGITPVLRAALEARWLELTRRILPGLAAERGWPIGADHCFQRVLLDATFGGVWYDHVPTRPAYRIMPIDVLVRAVELAEAVATRTIALEPLNRASLGYRRKLR